MSFNIISNSFSVGKSPKFFKTRPISVVVITPLLSLSKKANACFKSCKIISYMNIT